MMAKHGAQHVHMCSQ
ncbi:MAG TPA: hypothetical protein EYM81_05415 [Candidatus Poseidoniales archaeon]|nr:hypothetical protein [Candidatus Poseidoniales archaeon]HIB41200.1 hypothetical protein [Candidatus Poseidoniales archaeon]HIN45204.1 hypothetical protein [Candidatus Poseidoniales archaeon]HIO86323.1 hypothetical protein [Candidatus Poseidoniales archaeon]